MLFSRIVLRNVRIIESAEIEAGEGFNYITGANGSGKTSLLEGIYTLSSGNSFRPCKPTGLLRHTQPHLTVLANYTHRKDKKSHHIGLQREKNGEIEVRIDRVKIHKLADLSLSIPVIALHPESHQLINGGPSLRRKLVDWGVFHVEPAFYPIWRDYKRALEQRNTALKKKENDNTVQAWNHKLAEDGETLTRYRANYLSALQQELTALQAEAGWPTTTHCSLQRGWSENQTLIEELNRNLKRDRLYTTTTVGAHRAEVRIIENGEEVKLVQSRGQQKTLVYLLRLAQARLHYRAKSTRCVFLCDDFPSELDSNNRNIICDLLLQSGHQIFASGVVEASDAFSHPVSHMFHVEHGQVRQVV